MKASPFPGLTLGEFAELPLAARIACAAAPFLGWRYAFTTPRVPYAAGTIPGLIVGGEMVTNCSTMTTAILMATFATYARDWTHADYADLQVFAGSLKAYPFGDSPIVAAERQRLGQAVGDFDEGHWHLVQTWRRKNAGGSADPTGGGHATLVFFDGDVCWTLEATGNRSGGVGAQFTAKPLAYFDKMALCHRLRLWP